MILGENRRGSQRGRLMSLLDLERGKWAWKTVVRQDEREDPIICMFGRREN